jgi:hypothetical protein
MSKQNPILKRTTSAMWQAIHIFMVGTDGIAGAVLVELAIITPVIIIMIISISDIGLFAFRQMQVQHAAQTGAQYASHNYKPNDPLFSLPSYLSAISSAVVNDDNGTTYAISATPAPTSPFCACPTSTGLSAATCASICTDGSTAGSYVTVSADATYNALFVTTTLGSSSPFSAGSYNLTASATVRVQ